MQKGLTIPTPELLAGIAVSLLLHILLWQCKGIYQPAEIHFSSGAVAVELTLAPTIESVPAEPEPKPEPPVEQEQEAAPPTPPAAEEVLREEATLPAPEPAEAVQSEAPSEPVVAEPVKQPAPEFRDASQEQAASLQENKGATTEAAPISHCSPIYPPISQRRGEEGTTVLSVDIDASGRATKIQIQQSSGHRHLDNAAINAIRKARFTPAQRFGEPVASTLTMPFRFELTQ